jgi:hypothetical protein
MGAYLFPKIVVEITPSCFLGAPSHSHFFRLVVTLLRHQLSSFSNIFLHVPNFFQVNQKAPRSGHPPSPLATLLVINYLSYIKATFLFHNIRYILYSTLCMCLKPQYNIMHALTSYQTSQVLLYLCSRRSCSHIV